MAIISRASGQGHYSTRFASSHGFRLDIRPRMV